MWLCKHLLACVSAPAASLISYHRCSCPGSWMSATASSRAPSDTWRTRWSPDTHLCFCHRRTRFSAERRYNITVSFSNIYVSRAIVVITSQTTKEFHAKRAGRGLSYLLGVCTCAAPWRNMPIALRPARNSATSTFPSLLVSSLSNRSWYGLTLSASKHWAFDSTNVLKVWYIVDPQWDRRSQQPCCSQDPIINPYWKS